MSLLEHDQNDTESLRDVVQTNQKLLANLEGDAESSSDRGGTTDEEVDILEPFQVDVDDEIDSLIAVSIGPMQNHMKSPRTPLVEKVQALQESPDYFNPDPLKEQDSDTLLAETSDRAVPVVDIESSSSTLSPRTSQPPTDQRSSVTRAILNNTQNENRKRAGSGPAAILDGLKKMFTDSSVSTSPGLSIRGNDFERTGGAENKQTNTAVPNRADRSKTLVQPRLSSPYSAGLDGAVSSSEQSNARPTTLRRVTSDNSLYLRKATTGASDFDNTGLFADVGEMSNPRLKAITDSLADSSLKMPKFSSMVFGSPRIPSPRTNSETTSRNTISNSGIAKSSASSGSNQLPSVSVTQHLPASEKKHPLLTEALSQLTGDVVIMGGYRGSVLRSAEPPYQQLWVPVKVGLNLRKVDLEVGLTREDEERMEETIKPSGILSHIGPIDIGRRLLKKFRKCPNAKANQLRVHDWGYDWRLSPHLLSQRLIKFVEGLPCNRPGTPHTKRGALIIAHSLGGLLTRHAVNERPELFSGVVYAGAPQNCCNILGPLRNGDDVLLSSRVLTAQVNFTLRTSYALLPEDGRCFLNKTTGERYDIDFFDVNSWDKFSLSPCINPPLPASTPPKKTLVGSITDSISSMTPSFPTKRLSWFSNSTPNTIESSEASPTRDTFKEKAHDAKEDIQSAANTAAEGIRSPKQEVQISLEPSMNSSHNKPSVATAVTIPRDQAYEYLKRTLAEVKQFKAELRHNPAHQEANRYPPNAIIFGKTVPTVYGAKVASREAIKNIDAFENLAFAAGDGVVLASAAQLPEGYRCVKGGRVQTDRGHIGLLGDLEGIGQCLQAVVEGRKRGIGFGNFT